MKHLLSQCRACAQHHDKQPNESIVSDPELKPWTSLSIDNFEYKGRHYLIILDRCTKFVVVKHVHSYDAGTTVETMCEVFNEFGLPENIHSDRGRNFLSSQFTQFLNDLGIDLTFCSAYHHSSNPAECAIRNVKNLMKHCGTVKLSCWYQRVGCSRLPYPSINLYTFPLLSQMCPVQLRPIQINVFPHQ